MICGEHLEEYRSYDNLDKSVRLLSRQPSSWYSKLVFEDTPYTLVKDGVSFSRLDRGLGEEQPPYPPQASKLVWRVWKLFLAISEAESQDGFGTGFHLRNPRPGFSAQPLFVKITPQTESVKNG